MTELEELQQKCRDAIAQALEPFGSRAEDVVLPTLAQMFVLLAIRLGGKKRFALQSLDRIWTRTVHRLEQAQKEAPRV